MKSKRTGQFKKLFDKLPPSIRDIARRAFGRWRDDPFDPMLDNHELHDSTRGRHRKGSRAVSITIRYRAIYVEDRDPNGQAVAIWYWIGSHEDYNNFVGS